MNVLDFIFPQRCVGCGRVGSYICNRCLKHIQILPQKCSECDRPAIDGLTHPVCKRKFGLDGLISVFRYDGVIKKAIKQLKYRFVYDVAETIVKTIPNTTWQNFQFLTSETVLYPIPLHKDRLKWRGFNQAEKLGKFIANKLNLKLIDELLIRSQKRTPQADISHRADRIKNARGLFSISTKFKTSNPPTGGLSILLFDDVWTTGATMKEAAKVLKRSGVKKVWGMTLAR